MKRQKWGRTSLRFIASLSFVFIFVSFHAQNLRVYYQYDYVSDTMKPTEQKTAVMCLDIVKDHSEFFSLLRYKQDSVLTVSNWDSAGRLLLEKEEDFPYRIVKNKHETLYKSNEMYLGNLIVKDNRKIIWTLLNETKLIMNYQVQKATAKFAGRIWTAYFTQEIPISDGPYKFKGLPGLIVKIEDSQHQHIFTMTGIKRLSENHQYPVRTWRKKEKELNLEEYKKYWNKYRQNPGAQIRMNYMMGKIPDQIRSDGHTETGAETTRRIEQQLIKKVAAENNPIELDLFE